MTPGQKFALPRFLPEARKGGFAILDHGLFAGTNFMVNILLARWLEPAQYGAFTIAHSVFVLFVSLHTAVLVEPMLVFGTGRYADCFPKYLELLIRGHWGFTTVIALLLGVVTLIIWQFDSWALAQALGGLALALPFILLLWLLRRAFYVRFQPQWAAAGAGLYMALMLAGIYRLYWENWLSPASALAMMGLVSLVVSLGLTALLRSRSYYAGSDPTPEMVLASHWSYGRWATATAASRWVSNHIYYAVLPAWIGLEGGAALRAVMNLVEPLRHAIAAISAFLLPRFVEVLKNGGKVGLQSCVSSAFILFAAGAAFYWVFLLLFRNEALLWLYGGRYTEYAHLLILAGLLPLTNSAVSVLSTAFRAMERPDQVFWCRAVSVSVALPLGLWLLAVMGVAGAIMGLLASSVAAATALVLSYLVRKQ